MKHNRQNDVLCSLLNPTGHRQSRSLFQAKSIFSCVEAFPGSRAFLHVQLLQTSYLLMGLGHPNVPQHLKSVLRTMRLIARSVPCTEGYRENMRHQVQALQLWLGAPAMFVTLNPADTKHPFTLRFASGLHWEGLDLQHPADAALHHALLQVNLLHRVATDPVAVANAFHHHVMFFLEEILGCRAFEEQPHPDGMPSSGHSPFGGVSGFYGIVEPQLRGSLHLHLLLHLYGFSTAEKLLHRFRAAIPELTHRLLAWASSLACTSLEALPRVLRFTDSENVLASLQPLPLPVSQQRLLQEQVGSAWNFELQASAWHVAAQRPVLATPPWIDPRPEPLQALPEFCPWPRSCFCDAPDPLPSHSWSRMLLFDLRHAALYCCLHECRPRVCHKGRLGHRGFCRLGFWHWRDVSQWTSPDTWQRCHGHALQDHDMVGAIPPSLGRLLPERHHPFHTRYNPCALFAFSILSCCYIL